MSFPGDDAASTSNQPLVPKASEPKDYEAAAASLMSTYGFGGTMQPNFKQSNKTNDKKTKGQLKPSAGENESGNSS
ncbi:hypothetical protein DFH11DRAFT_1883188 [Phellopilus nigrolimitatus]|nr:hypothetical protein DFH11DRAFT_1883188 [Phellopilus nigrolimitatus]